MAYNPLDDLRPDQLRGLLNDTQSSLAASLARIEAYRIENKLLAGEVTTLRSSLGEGAAPDEQQATEKGASPASSSIAPSGGKHNERGGASQWSSTASGAVLVSELTGQHAIEIVTAGKKEAANLLITKEFVEIVTSKGLIRAHEFVGITSVKQTSDTGGGSAPESGRGRWQMIWNKDNVAQRMVFEASTVTMDSLSRHVDRWLGLQDATSQEGVLLGDKGESVPPHHLYLGDSELLMVGPASEIVSTTQQRALASALPPMERMRNWSLTYSTTRHGISLATLYRRQQDKLPSLTLIKDSGGHIFGVYSADSWKVNPRFYGSGETFVFQLEPHMVYYPWRSMSTDKNDFFMYCTPEALAVGGLGHFAIHVDSELLQGSSGSCGTFGSPCLSSKEEFKIMIMEVWQAV